MQTSYVTHVFHMSDDTNKIILLTSSASGQSDINVSSTPTMSHNNEANGIPINDMVEIIKLKDLQIYKLQETIDQQSLQIQKQTAAIEIMQQQMTELTTSLASFVQQSNKPPDKKIAPIFTAVKKNIPDPTVNKGRKCKTAKSSSSTASNINTQSGQPSLVQPNPKRPRHLMENESSNVESTVLGNNVSFSTIPPANDTDDISTINNDLSKNNISMNVSNNVSNDTSISDPNDDESNDDWTNFCPNKDGNFLNFKKNAINKEKNITPIEISIKNDEKGSLHALLIRHFDNNSFLWSNASKRSI